MASRGEFRIEAVHGVAPLLMWDGDRYGLVKKAEKGNPTKVIPDTAAAEADGGPTSYLEVDTRTEQICVVRQGQAGAHCSACR